MSFGSKPKAPKPTPDQLALEAAQREAAAKLDSAENERRKRLLNAAEGTRAYAGSPLFRGLAQNAAANGFSVFSPTGGISAPRAGYPGSAGGSGGGGGGSRSNGRQM